jgi:hypothetical protein
MITCGGPIFNRSYPDYFGPIKPEHYDKLCLKCGSPDVDYYVHGGVRRFGLCAKHKSIFDKVEGPGVQQPIVVRDPNRPV